MNPRPPHLSTAGSLAAAHCHRRPAQTMISDLPTLLATMRPVLNPGRYVFVTLSPDQSPDANSIIASVREPEGLSVILTEQDANDLGHTASYVAAWISLTVESDLAAVGLTAAFSNALAQAGISCNVVAGNQHDHLFVPHEQAQTAMNVLQSLQADATARDSLRGSQATSLVDSRDA